MSGTASGATGGNTNILREFLLKLGYSVDEGSQRKFADALKYMTTTIAGLGAALAGTVAGVVAGVAHMAESMESLHYVSVRTKSSVENIEAFKFAFSQLGGTASQAQGLLEKFSAFLRESPGHVGWVEQFTGHKLTDAVQGLNDLGRAFQHMLDTGYNYSQVRGIAEQMGIGEMDLQVLLRNTQDASDEYKKMAEKIIGDQDAAANNAVTFMQRYRSLLSAISDFAIRFGNDLTVGLTADIEKLRVLILNNADDIKAAVDAFASGIITAIHIIVQFGTDTVKAIRIVRDEFNSLPESVQEVIKVVGLLGAAWVAFNLLFLSTPVGRILALGIALVEVIAHFDDLKAGAVKAFDYIRDSIPWKAWGEAATSAIAHVGEGFSALGEVLHHFWTVFVDDIRGIGERIGRVFEPIFNVMSRLKEWLPTWSNTPTGSDSNGRPVYGAFGPLEKGVGWVQSKFGGAPNVADTGMSKEQQAFLKTLSTPESGGRYDIKQGGSKILDLSQFPSGIGPGGISSASGRYQFTDATWREAAQALGLKDFSPTSQDKAAWWLASREYKQRMGRDLQSDLASGGHENDITSALRGRWPSLPGGSQSHLAQGDWNTALKGNLNPSPTGAGLAASMASPDMPNLFPANYNPSTKPAGFDVMAMTNAPPPAFGLGATAAQGGGGTVINQTNNFSAPNTEDPQKAVQALSTQLARTNADLIRDSIGYAQ